VGNTGKSRFSRNTGLTWWWGELTGSKGIILWGLFPLDQIIRGGGNQGRGQCRKWTNLKGEESQKGRTLRTMRLMRKRKKGTGERVL